MPGMSAMSDLRSSDLVSLLDECWKQIDPTDITSGYDVEVIANASVLLARAAHRLRELEHEHDAILRGRCPTHRCKVCGALWIDWGQSWSLFSLHCGQCCDNVAMGDQIEQLPTPVVGNGETVGRAIAETTRTSDEPAGVRGCTLVRPSAKSPDLCHCRDVLVVNGKCNQCGKPIRFSDKATLIPKPCAVCGEPNTVGHQCTQYQCRETDCQWSGAVPEFHPDTGMARCPVCGSSADVVPEKAKECLAEQDGWCCTRPIGHAGQHEASDGIKICHVWPPENGKG